MSDDLLTSKEAARRLGITVATLYDWLAHSDVGQLVIRGEPVTIDYLQGGSRGQGRIAVEPREVGRLKDLMRVRPRRPSKPPRSPATTLHHISAQLGRPDDEP